jgi:hypothetical protein
MKVYILGIDHEIQKDDGHTEAALKVKFEELLRQLVRESGIDFIGEETFSEDNTIAKRIADSLGIPRKPIEMSRKARTELGIAEEQKNGRYECIIGEDGTPMGFKSKRVLSDRIREEYMFWRTLTEVGMAQSILILCGFIHAEELGQRFEKAGHQVTTDSLCKRSWYSHPEC